MFRRTVAPGRFRRRLTVAFVIVAGVSALTLALGSYLLVRQARLDESLDRAATDLRYQLVLAEQFLPLDPERSANLLGSFERSGRHVVLRDDGRSAASNPAFDPVLPTVLRSSVAAGRLAYQRLDVDGRHLLVVGARIRASAAELYVVYLEDAIHDDLARLGTTLLGGWGGVGDEDCGAVRGAGPRAPVHRRRGARAAYAGHGAAGGGVAAAGGPVAAARGGTPAGGAAGRRRGTAAPTRRRPDGDLPAGRRTGGHTRAAGGPPRRR